MLQGFQLFGCGVGGVFYAVASLAGVAGQQGGKVFGVGQRCVVLEHAAQKISKSLAFLFLRFGGMRRQRPKISFVGRKAEALQRDAVALAFAQQQPVSQVGDQHQFVTIPVFGDLNRGGSVVYRLGWCFDFDNAS